MKSFARFALATAVVAVLSASSAPAQTVISFYDVNPTFATTLGPPVTIVNGPITSSISATGFANLTYTSTATQAAPNITVVNPPPFSNQNLGVFTLTLGPSANFTIPAATSTFALTVVQTIPSGGSQTLTSQLTGSVVTIGAAQSSTIGLAFNNPNFTIGNVQYALNNLTNSGGFSNVFLVAPGNNTLSVRVTATAVPEPSTLAMAGMGGLSLLGYGLRRYRKLAA